MATRLAGAMTESRIRVARATDMERFVAAGHLVWFDEVPDAPVEEQLLGLPEDQRYAAETWMVPTLVGA